MGIKHLLSLATAAAVSVGAGAATFDWTPTITCPYVTADVTASWQLETLSFNCNEPGAEITDIMPIWIDEDGYEIVATGGIHDFWGFDPTSFEYSFNVSDFKKNGEYILLLPQGMLVNGAGAESAKKEIYYTFDVPDLMGAMFADFKVLSTDPDLNYDQGIWNDQTLTVNTNHNNAIGLTKLTVTDLTEGEIMFMSSNFTTGREPGSSEPITWKVAGDWKFFDGHNYKAELVFYNGKDEKNSVGTPTPIVDRVSYRFKGKVEPYKYSPIELLSVEPNPDSYIISEPSEAVFVYTFSGPVTVYKAETPLGPNGTYNYSTSYLSSNADKTEWTLNLSEDQFVNSEDTNITINVYARDLDGYTVKGNSGYEENSCFQYSWECELGAPTFTIIPAQGAVLDELTKVVCKSSNDNQMAWSWTKTATVQTLSRQLVGTLIPDEGKPGDKQVTFSNWKNAETGAQEPIHLTKKGSYVLVFEKGCFTFGTQFDAKGSHNMASGFEITGKNDNGSTPDPADQEVLEPSSISPEKGSKVESLSEIRISFPEEIGLLTYDAYLYSADAMAVESNYLQKAELSLDMDDWNLVIATLEAPVTTDGEYVLFIPARTIGNTAFADSMGETGICNTALFIPYMVGDGSGSVDAVVETEISDVYDIHGRIVMRKAAYGDLKTLPKGIYVYGGKKVII